MSQNVSCNIKIFQIVPSTMGEQSPSRGISSRNFKTSRILQPDKSSKEQICSDIQSLKKKKQKSSTLAPFPGKLLKHGGAYYTE